MLILPSTVASHYYNCCTDDSTSPGNYGYHLVQTPKIMAAILNIVLSPGTLLGKKGIKGLIFSVSH
jgi:hypothetical protein